MKRFRQKYYDYFSHIYDRFVALHSTDRALRLRYFLADNTGLKKGDMEHDVPKNFFVRLLFYLRLLSIGPKKALEIVRHERELLIKYFQYVEKMSTPTGRSKIMICRGRGT
jgi:hypothetical protein